MKKLLLLSCLLLSGCVKTNQINYKDRFYRLAENETLQIHFAKPVNSVPYLEVTHDEINWYYITNEWFTLDYKADPGTYYLDIDNILLWGIERK